MFEVNGRTIRLSRGDTGVIPFRVTGMELTGKDAGVFTIRRANGTTLVRKVIPVMEDGLLYVPFVNEETDGWREGEYLWDLRIVLEAQVGEDGMVTDGREVITPWPPSRLEVIGVVGEV